MFQLSQDVQEELERDSLSVGDLLALHGSPTGGCGGGELCRGPHRVVGLRRDSHVHILLDRKGSWRVRALVRSGWSDVQPEDGSALVDPTALGGAWRGRRAIQDREGRRRVEVLVQRAEERLAIGGPLARERPDGLKLGLIDARLPSDLLIFSPVMWTVPVWTQCRTNGPSSACAHSAWEISDS